MGNAQNNYKDKIITIPNILSFFRFCLIPIIVWLYLGKGNSILTGLMVLFSSLTDIVDGVIARRFNMTSDIGKVLDPIADKATQGAVVLLLATKFPLILIVAALILVKEVFMAITGYMVVKRCGIVLAAEWYGKMSTVVIVAAIALHLFWPGISTPLSDVTIILTAISVAFALTMYAIRNLGYLNSAR